jgi:hypothetical protein
MVFGLRFGQGLCLNQLGQPLGQRHQLLLAGGRGRGGFGLEALAVIGEQGRINAVGFGPLALGLGGGADLRGVGDRDGNLRLVEGLDQRPFIAAGGFTDDVNVGCFCNCWRNLARPAGWLGNSVWRPCRCSCKLALATSTPA